MSLRGTPRAYLVMSMMRARGSLVVESETICFDRDFAIAMAREDEGRSVWSGVYPLDADGRCVAGGPLFSIGTLTHDEVLPPRGRGASRYDGTELPAQRPAPRFATNDMASKGEPN